MKKIIVVVAALVSLLGAAVSGDVVFAPLSNHLLKKMEEDKDGKGIVGMFKAKPCKTVQDKENCTIVTYFKDQRGFEQIVRYLGKNIAAFVRIYRTNLPLSTSSFESEMVLCGITGAEDAKFDEATQTATFTKFECVKFQANPGGIIDSKQFTGDPKTLIKQHVKQ